MKILNKTGFIIGIISTILIFLGLSMMQKDYYYGEYIMYFGFIVAGIVWIWSIWDVIFADDLKGFQKTFWLILTVSVPVMGGMLFYMMHQKKGKIVT
ncbi:hypothetical protein HHL16_16430 [Pseudoflavitalea sp. G-6-1-2]|uniref:PLDc N-terminal domain-containing protein n=1 Tax=Pseudoflavitalea sp. G-6-1-2 TaxID=2728841 RepID=UPI00146C71B6|nr:PLDc N-terminal domain-containing protein [Pseudoflavitalea sp. G-6-1-2]NML22472.1 hypothetical protein [Pseudoflavitalea sp. G-6-1-2]